MALEVKMTPITTEKNSTNNIILFLIVIFGFVAGYFFYGKSSEDPASAVPASTVVLDDSLAKFRTLRLDFSAFDDAAFKALRIFGESPVRPGVTGRTDIFAPF